jgi:hypothetical protein
MNPQIRDLFKEAYTHFNNGQYFTQELLADKFAELIGREVLAMVNRHGNIKSRVVKEYFGITDQT